MAYAVYMHTCPNGKSYVGITKTPVKRRWHNGGGYISQQYFYRAIQKYGWDNIKHDVLFEGLNEDEAKATEIRLIAERDLTNSSNGYNVSPGGNLGNALCGESNPFYGKHHSEEAKQKISQARRGSQPWNKGIKGMESAFKGKHHTESAKRLLSEKASQRTGSKNSRAKSVLCVTTGEVFETVTAAAKKVGCNQSNISHCLTGRRHSAGTTESGQKLLWQYINL